MLVDREIVELVRRLKGPLGLDERRIIKLAVSNLAASVVRLPVPRSEALHRLNELKKAA